MQMVRKSKDFLKWEWEERKREMRKEEMNWKKRLYFFDFKKRDIKS